MADQTKSAEQKPDEKPHRISAETEPGTAGPTPGSAEGDRETVEESLRQHAEKEQRQTTLPKQR